MVNKKIIQQIPECIVQQARHVLESTVNSTSYRKEVVTLIVGTCAVCDAIPNKIVIETHDGAELISRYCNKDFAKYQKYNKPKHKRKVKK